MLRQVQQFDRRTRAGVIYYAMFTVIVLCMTYSLHCHKNQHANKTSTTESIKFTSRGRELFASTSICAVLIHMWCDIKILFIDTKYDDGGSIFFLCHYVITQVVKEKDDYYFKGTESLIWLLILRLINLFCDQLA